MGPEVVLRELGIVQSFQSFILIVGLILGRIIPILTFNPFLGGQFLPANLKMGVALLIAMFLYLPLSSGLSQPLPEETLPYIVLMLKEVMFGMTIAFISTLVFFGIQSAGRIIDQARGSAMAQMLAPQTGGQVSLFGEIKFQFAIVLFFLLNGHHFFLRAVFMSFKSVPIETIPDFVNLSSTTITLLALKTGEVFTIGLMLAAPAVLAVFMADLVFGIINRVAPQINVFFLSMPVKMMLGIVIVFFILGFLAQQMRLHMVQMLRDVDTLIQLF
jgi:flagellar biosynthetic protein FliR